MGPVLPSPSPRHRVTASPSPSPSPSSSPSPSRARSAPPARPSAAPPLPQQQQSPPPPPPRPPAPRGGHPPSSEVRPPGGAHQRQEHEGGQRAKGAHPPPTPAAVAQSPRRGGDLRRRLTLKRGELIRSITDAHNQSQGSVGERKEETVPHPPGAARDPAAVHVVDLCSQTSYLDSRPASPPQGGGSHPTLDWSCGRVLTQPIVASGAIHIESPCRWGQGEAPIGPSSLIEAVFRWTFDGSSTGALE